MRVVDRRAAPRRARRVQQLGQRVRRNCAGRPRGARRAGAPAAGTALGRHEGRLAPGPRARAPCGVARERQAEPCEQRRARDARVVVRRAVHQHRHALAREQQREQRRQIGQLARAVVAGQHAPPAAPTRARDAARAHRIEEAGHLLGRLALDAHGEAEGADLEVGHARRRAAGSNRSLACAPVERRARRRLPRPMTSDVVADAHAAAEGHARMSVARAARARSRFSSGRQRAAVRAAARRAPAARQPLAVAPAACASAASISGVGDAEAAADLPAAGAPARCLRARAAAAAGRRPAAGSSSCSSGLDPGFGAGVAGRAGRPSSAHVCAVARQRARCGAGRGGDRRSAARPAPASPSCASMRRQHVLGRRPRSAAARNSTPVRSRAEGHAGREGKTRHQLRAAPARARSARCLGQPGERQQRQGSSAFRIFTAACLSSGCFDCGQNARRGERIHAGERARRCSSGRSRHSSPQCIAMKAWPGRRRCCLRPAARSSRGAR